MSAVENRAIVAPFPKKFADLRIITQNIRIVEAINLHSRKMTTSKEIPAADVKKKKIEPIPTFTKMATIFEDKKL